MSVYSEYRPHDGVFTSSYVTGQRPNDTIGGAWIEGRFDHTKKRVDVASTDVVDYTPPPPSLDDTKADKWAAIKASREAAIYAPLITPYGVFDANPISQVKIANSAQYAQALVATGRTAAIVFTLANNTDVTLNEQQMVSVGLTLGDREQAARSTARSLRDQIKSATLETIEGISWPLPNA